MRRLNRLSIYDFEIIYRKGCNNQNADGLSRLPINEDENENYIPEDEILINLIQEIQTSEDIIIIYSHNLFYRKLTTFLYVTNKKNLYDNILRNSFIKITIKLNF
jgi:hypothetical protein